MLTILSPDNPRQPFPPPQRALDEPNGLLAIGGCLSTERIERAYRNGIFPWYSQGEPILWWSPDPRMVLRPADIVLSRSLKRTLRRGRFGFSFDACFEDVIDACGDLRASDPGTWITPDMREAYCRLHRYGLAHSFEAWADGQLAGGLYGVAIGRVFFGESMFFRVTDASKACFAFAAARLAEWNYELIDCQVRTDHLARFGATEIPRVEFLRLLAALCDQAVRNDAWVRDR